MHNVVKPNELAFHDLDGLVFISDLAMGVVELPCKVFAFLFQVLGVAVYLLFLGGLKCRQVLLYAGFVSTELANHLCLHLTLLIHILNLSLELLDFPLLVSQLASDLLGFPPELGRLFLE